jgi:hypothetical protein
MASRWPPEARTEFEWCIQNEQLCFETANDCILERLFGGQPLPHIVIGVDLSYSDGTQVALAVGGVIERSEVVGGGFSVSVLTEEWIFGSPAFVWVDADGDGACDNQLDRFAAEYVDFNLDFAAPAFVEKIGSGRLIPAEGGSDRCSLGF